MLREKRQEVWRITLEMSLIRRETWIGGVKSMILGKKSRRTMGRSKDVKDQDLLGRIEGP